MDANDAIVRSLLSELGALEREHNQLLAGVQRSRARSATVEGTLSDIQVLSPKQVDLLTEAALAARHALYRSAIVAAFAALIDSLHERIDRLGALAPLAAAKGWRLTAVDDLQEHSDHQVAEGAKQVAVISKAQMKSVHGLLHRRNQAAHPTGYQPNLDEALGFISEAMALLAAFGK